MNINVAMSYLSNLVIYIAGLPLDDSEKKLLREACNLGISALKTIEDMKGEHND